MDLSPHLGNTGEFPRSRLFSARGVFLPAGTDQTLQNVDRVLAALKAFDGRPR